MIKLRGGGNPFYVLLVLAGVLFVVTACAYGVMAFHQASPHSQPLSADDMSLLALLDRHGVWILGGQVLLLGLLTFGAMGTDGYWDRRDQRKLEQRGETAQNESTPQPEITPQPGEQPQG